jgi:hypothetical protein
MFSHNQPTLSARQLLSRFQEDLHLMSHPLPSSNSASPSSGLHRHRAHVLQPRPDHRHGWLCHHLHVPPSAVPVVEDGRVCDTKSEQTAQTGGGHAIRATAALLTQPASVVRRIAQHVHHAGCATHCATCCAMHCATHSSTQREACRGQTVKLMTGGDVVQVVTSQSWREFQSRDQSICH